jgi:hypothetical protein
MTMPGQALHVKNVNEFVDAFRQARLRRHRSLRRNRLRTLPIDRHHADERRTAT